MKTPRKAIILCAGYGTRLAPLTNRTPKPLIPLWGEPLLTHTLRTLHRWGVTEALLNLHHNADRMLNYILHNLPADTPSIELSFEPEILGTGGALHRANWFFQDDPVWIVNGDIAFDLDPAPLIRLHRRHRAAAVLWFHPTAGPRTVELCGNEIVTFRSQCPGAPGTYTFCGLQLVAPELLDAVKPTGFSTLVDAYETAQKNGDPVLAAAPENVFWADMGTPESCLRAHADSLKAYRQKRPGCRLMVPSTLRRMRQLRKSGVTIRGFSAVPEDAVVAPGATLCRSVLMENTRIHADAVLENTLIGPETTIHGPLSGIVVRAADLDAGTAGNILKLMKWPLERTTANPLPPRGSDRAFTRLQWGRRRRLLMQYGTDRVENEYFTRHAGFLRRLGIPVPAILKDMPRDRLVAMEDISGPSLETWAPSVKPAVWIRQYQRVLRHVATLHTRGAREAARRRLPLHPPFNAALYRWERELFRDLFLARRIAPDSWLVADAMQELHRISRRLQTQPLCLLHRDLQSSNILIQRGHPVFIDFQGMRLGAAVYDLASLLCDPYQSIPESIRMDLLTYYADLTDADEKALHEAFAYGAVQRLVQALGAYGRLGANRATRRFLKYIPPALTILRKTLIRLDNFPHMRKLVDICLEKENDVCGRGV
jgi:NDP-sugar pyrophosphorylase family protein/aminoglycoside/choline kinase family phosphotransferase